MDTNSSSVIRRFLPGGFLSAILLLAFTACQGPQREVDIQLTTELTQIAEVIRTESRSLVEKLSLIQAAIESGQADEAAQLELIREALVSLSGSADELFSQMEAALSSRTTPLETKLALIQAAISGGFADCSQQQELLLQAISSLGNAAEERLAAIQAEIQNRQSALTAKLALIDAAVTSGLAGEKEGQELIQQALTALEGTGEEKLDKIEKAMESRMTSLSTKLEAVRGTVADSLATANEALGLIQAAVESLVHGTVGGDPEKKASIDNLVTRLAAIQATMESEVDGILASILNATKGRKDDIQILQTIQQELRDLDIVYIQFNDFVSDGVLAVGLDYPLEVPYSLVTSASDIRLDVSASQGITAAAEPDAVNPLKGILKVSASDITDGESCIHITVPGRFKLRTFTLSLVQEQMSAPTGQDKTLQFNQTDPLEFHYSTNTPTVVFIPDTASWIRRIYDVAPNGSPTDSVIRIAVDPNLGFYQRETSITVKNHVSKHSLKFNITQDYNSTVISFDASNSSLQTAFVLDTKHINFNKDNFISMAEAAAVTSLDSLFGPGLYNGQLEGHKCEYTSFDEFQYFTGIDTIPAGSFHNWVNLTSITLPPSITTIEGGNSSHDGPFTDCPKLEAIKGPFTVNDQMLVYDKKLLKVAETATSVTIPSDVEIIGAKAFYKSNVQSIAIPSSVKKIRDHAFEYSQVESVKFAMTGTDPKTATAYVDSLAENSFVHCFKLKSFKGPENGTSTVRVTRDRLCLCRDTTLYAFAMGSGLVDYAIPESAGVKKLAACVFSAQPSTSSENPDPSAVQWLKIGLPSTLTHVGDHAFSFQKATPRMEVFFKGENPPKADAGVFDNTSTKRLIVPPVKNGGQVNLEATTARGHQFENAMGGDNYFSPSYYDVWPFAEGIPMVATIAAKQGYVCDSNPGSSIPGQWSDLGQDTVAVLYTVEGVNKRAHARVAAVDANGVATISFVVDYKTMDVASNIACQLVYPPRAVNDANTCPKDYHVMSDSQTGDESKYLDVHVGSGSFNTAGAPSLTIDTPLHPIYSLFIIKLNSGNETKLSVKDKDNNPVVTMDARLGEHGRDTYYFSMPASNSSMYYISSGAKQSTISMPTSSSYTQATPPGYVFPFDVTLE